MAIITPEDVFERVRDEPIIALSNQHQTRRQPINNHVSSDTVSAKTYPVLTTLI